MSVMCSACRVSSATAESRRGICRTTSWGQTARALRNESNQATENSTFLLTVSTMLSRRHCIQQSAARRGAQVSNATRRGVRGGAREVDGQNTGVGLHAGTVLRQARRMKCSLPRGSRSSRYSFGDAKKTSRNTDVMC